MGLGGDIMANNPTYAEIFGKPHPNLVIPESFDLCFTYEEQIAYLAYYLADALDRIKLLEEKVKYSA